MNRLYDLAVIAIALLAAGLLAGCGSTQQRQELLWQSAEFSPSETGTQATIRMVRNSKTFLTGRAEKAEDGSWTVYPERLHWFSNWKEGWTEADISTTGKLAASEREGGWKVSTVEPFAAEYAERAQVRYQDNRVTGDECVALFDRRINRIRAAAYFLNEKFDGKSFPEFGRGGAGSAFAVAAGQTLFPEIYGYPEGTAESQESAETRKKGEGIVWDAGYSASGIPENLREVRDTGTLYRDWEETSLLFYYIYELER